MILVSNFRSNIVLNVNDSKINESFQVALLGFTIDNHLTF